MTGRRSTSGASMISEIQTYSESVSFLGGVWLLLLLAVNWAFSAIHLYEEWKGSEFPLWRAFGAIEGVYVPNWLGFPFFTVALLLILWVVGVGGIVGLGVVGTAGEWLSVGALSAQEGMFWLGAVVGALLSDTLFSHWIPYLASYRPNPGLRSTALYALEAILLLALFSKGLSAYPASALVGALLGALFFLAVWGILVALRLCVAPWRRPPWVSGQPIPSWAKT
jgi:hypothetical protein